MKIIKYEYFNSWKSTRKRAFMVHKRDLGLVLT